jgi:hypothetical protein
MLLARDQITTIGGSGGIHLCSCRLTCPNYYYGTDTSTYAYSFAATATGVPSKYRRYRDFFVGRIGSGAQLERPISRAETAGDRDVVNDAIASAERALGARSNYIREHAGVFEGGGFSEVAAAGSGRSFAYWTLTGFNTANRTMAYAWGVLQGVMAALGRRDGPFFADIEGGSETWPAVPDTANRQVIQQEVLRGFLDGVAGKNYVPGVYTSPEFFQNLFGVYPYDDTMPLFVFWSINTVGAPPNRPYTVPRPTCQELDDFFSETDEGRHIPVSAMGQYPVILQNRVGGLWVGGADGDPDSWTQVSWEELQGRADKDTAITGGDWDVACQPPDSWHAIQSPGYSGDDVE